MSTKRMNRKQLPVVFLKVSWAVARFLDMMCIGMLSAYKKIHASVSRVSGHFFPSLLDECQDEKRTKKSNKNQTKFA